MPTYLFYDTLRLNRRAGGVLNVSEVLLRSMRLSPGEQVESAAARHPWLFGLARWLGLSRFLLETLLYNGHALASRLSGRRLFSLFPNYFLPFTPFGRHRDSIVIVHDLQYRTYPQHFSRIKRLWLDWNLRRVARSEAHVVFISRSSQQDFERHFGRCRRPSVIFNPVDAVGSLRSLDVAPQGERYLIAPYHYYPHKNFIGTLRLFERMKRDGLVDWLDITGNGADEVARMVASTAPALRDSVRHRGLVSREELIRLYRGASAFISLSTFEGFNLSAAEAATLGVPLLLSDIPVHRELFGGYGFFVRGESCALGPLASYLATHQQVRPVWRNAMACAPAAVAGRYLRLKRGAAPIRGARRRVTGGLRWVGAALLLAATALVSAQPAVAPRTPVAGTLAAPAFGVMVHYLPAPGAFDDMARLDVEALADALVQMRASYLVLTLGQNNGQYIAPNAALEALCPASVRHRPPRDLPLKIGRALHARGIAMVLYLPFRAPQHAPELMDCLGDVSERQPPPARFIAGWSAVIGEWSQRYGSLAAGWWFDGTYNTEGLSNADWQALCQAAHSGSAGRWLAFNAGEGAQRFGLQAAPCQNVMAGEFMQPPATLPMPPGPPSALVFHLLTPLAHNWGQPGPARFTAAQLRGWIAETGARQGLFTLDLPLDTDLRFMPAHVALVRRATTPTPGS